MGFKAWNAVAHAYDFLDNLLFIISGSEMGILGSILGNPESPLFGRAHAKVTMKEAKPWQIPGIPTAWVLEAGAEVDDRRFVDALDTWLIITSSRGLMKVHIGLRIHYNALIRRYSQDG